jgi:succinoglycan biosynthesis protein ExoA
MSATPPLPLVTVLIPVLGEERDIVGCIDAVAAQTWPLDRLEVLLVDGCSKDHTVATARRAAAAHHFAAFRVLSNPRRRTSTSLNVGLDVAEGDVVVRVDARSRIAPNHVARCVDVLASRPDVAVVGGAQVATPRSSSVGDRGIARALNNRMLTGFARYRRSRTSGAADTVWMGAFRAADLREIGGWDDATALNEDFELNERFRRAGRVVWFDADLPARYLPRADLRLLARQYARFGRVKGLWWAKGRRPGARQIALLLAPPLASVVALAAGRRVGARPVAAAAVAAAALADHVGNDGAAAPLPVRASAITANVVAAGSWWCGVWAGALGALVGVRHQHDDQGAVPAAVVTRAADRRRRDLAPLAAGQDTR